MSEHQAASPSASASARASSTTSPQTSSLVNLAEARLGASVLYANDDFFAEKENLLKPQKAVFIDGKYTDRGKWMDGWESRRKRVPGHDFAIVRLGVPGAIHEVVVDTAFFKGNFPESCSIEGAVIPGYPQPDELISDQIAWTEILPRNKLKGDSENRFKIASRERFTHVRLHIYPDGGVARLRILGEVLAEPRWMGRPGSTVDLAAVEHGAVVVACNDMFFGSRHNLIMPNRALDMGDGWETKRSRREGPDWVIVKLAGKGQLERIVLDTAHFKGNFPESAAVCVGTFGPNQDPSTAKGTAWTNVLARTKLTAHTVHVFDDTLSAHAPATHARLRIWPDGGVSRMRLYGVLSEEGREAIGLRALNALPAPDARKALLSTCSSTSWASAMVKKRPYRSLSDLLAKGMDLWARATDADILEAFAAHPRIGEKAPQGHATAQSMSWSGTEQSKVTQASLRAKKRLAAANAAYEKKFGRIYIVCATGKTAEEMVAIAERRLKNGPAKELKVAAVEQGKITELRLRKLVMR
jgi:allantoicase